MIIAVNTGGILPTDKKARRAASGQATVSTIKNNNKVAKTVNVSVRKNRFSGDIGCAIYAGMPSPVNDP